MLNNFYIVNYFGEWKQKNVSKRVQWVNSILQHLGLWVRLGPPPESGMTNVEQRMNLYHLVSQPLVYGVPGEVVELGCHQGQSTTLIRTVMNAYGADREFHVYDSFEGLPEKHEKDRTQDFIAGQLSTSEQVLVANFERLGLEPPQIHKGWFEATLSTQLPDAIAFAYLDGDFYDSIKVSLEHVYPKMSPGAVCLIDDYCDPAIYPAGWNKLPGVKTACDEFFANKPEEIIYVYSGQFSHAFFRKI